MAGDWIKMRQDLHDDPAVVGIAALLDLEEDTVVGKLHRIWCWADRHTTDGRAPAITDKWVDRYVSMPGFASAMVQMGWLSFSASGIQFPHFDRHNGDSAKRRAENTIRKRLSRQNRDEGMTGVERTVIPRPFARHVMERDSYRCVYCGEQSSKEQEQTRKAVLGIDHLIPSSRGGLQAVENLVCCCRECNNEKNDRTPEEWGMLPKFLSDGVTYVSQQISDISVTREEKRREEKKEQKTAPKGDLLDGIDEQVATDFKALRSKLRAPITATAMAGIEREAIKAGLSMQEALRVCCERGWRGFKAEWMEPAKVNGSKGGKCASDEVDDIFRRVDR